MRSSPCCCSTWRGCVEQPETPRCRRPWPLLRSLDRRLRTKPSSRGRTEPEKLSSCFPEPTAIKERHQKKTEACLLISGLDYCLGWSQARTSVCFINHFFLFLFFFYPEGYFGEKDCFWLSKQHCLHFFHFMFSYPFL